MSSGFLVKLDGPGVGFVVEPALAQAAVKDAGELIGECSDSHGVRLVAGLELLVVAASTGEALMAHAAHLKVASASRRLRAIRRCTCLERPEALMTGEWPT